MRSVVTMAFCLSDDLAAWVRDQAEREGLGISAYMRQLLLRERRRLVGSISASMQQLLLREPEEVEDDETE